MRKISLFVLEIFPRAVKIGSHPLERNMKPLIRKAGLSLNFVESAEVNAFLCTYFLKLHGSEAEAALPLVWP